MLQSLTSLSDNGAMGAGFPPSLATLSDLSNVFASLDAVKIPTVYSKTENEKREEEWLRQRLGKFTASEFHRLMANGKVQFTQEFSITGERGCYSVNEDGKRIETAFKTKAEATDWLSQHKARLAGDCLTTGALTYVEECVAEILAETELDTYTTHDMQWGKAHEAEAVQTFASVTGLNPYMTGDSQEFILDESGAWGCTPDGLIDENAGLEIKCPRQKTHLRYLQMRTQADLKEKCPEYYWQIQGCLMITNRSHWYFFSYDPRFISPAHRWMLIKVERDEVDISRLNKRLVMATAERDRVLNLLSPF